jgi:hypothetical protein
VGNTRLPGSGSQHAAGLLSEREATVFCQTAKVTNLLIIPTKNVSSAAGFNEPVQIVRKSNLKRLVHNFKSFFSEFKNIDLRDISDDKVQQFLKTHNLLVHEILDKYSETPKSD